jgi:chromosome segregation ATPase
MSRRSDETIEELKRIEKDTQILEQLSDRLGVLESKIEELADRKATTSSLSPENIQELVSKITALRNMIDKIEVEMVQLDLRLNDIESLRFKHRS